MTWASRQRRSPGAPARSQANTSASSGYTPNLPGTGPSPRRQGYLVQASNVARVRLSPPGTPVAPSTTFGSRRVSTRRVWAFPSKPPIPAATASRAASPLWPKGGWPRSWARQAASTTSPSQPSALPRSRPIWATSRLWVSRLRTKSSVSGATTWVLAASRRSALECTIRARSRAKATRRPVFGGSAKRRSRSVGGRRGIRLLGVELGDERVEPRQRLDQPERGAGIGADDVALEVPRHVLADVAAGAALGVL